MRRLLFAVNILIAIAILAAALALYWYVYRALPQTSGTISALVVQPVEVNRDAQGIPHIKARTLDDALFVQGYVTAEDRMWQMDSIRRLASGELSEIVGETAIEADRDARRLRLRRMAEQIYATLSVDDKAGLAAYTRGVNAFLESHRGRYGIEFTLLDYDPRPWSVVDSLLVGLQMFRTLASDWKIKFIKDQMLRGGEADKVNYLFPITPGTQFLPGSDERPGSNAWVVSGAHSATGKPLLSNDTHLEFNVPGIWYAAHLVAPGLNAEGVTFPGVPGIIAGHNDRIAWGETNLGFSVQDLYIEKIDLRSGRYAFQGRVEQARQERELIVIKGRPAEEMNIWVTRHGPVFQESNGRIMTLQWTAAQPGVFQNVFLDIDRARNWSDFKRSLARFGGPGQNFVYADVDGNIGYQVAGRLPIRRNYQGDVPVDGSTGENEWDGYIPFEQLPQSYNPKAGMLVTANQNPFPANYPYRVQGNFGSNDRAQQITDMLNASGNKLKPADNLRIEKDVYSGFHKFLARQLAAAYAGRGASDPHFSGVIDMLRTWDGQMDKERPEPFVTTLAFQYIRKGIAERASPGNGGVYEIQISAAVTERLLKERPAGWFSDYNQFLLQCFADAMEEGHRIQGSDPARWKWGKYMYLNAPNPVVGRVPVVGKWFNVGPEPMSGGTTTVKQTTRRLSPSERINMSLANWDDSLMNLPLGESAHVASSHYRDEWQAFYVGAGYPMQFNHVDVKSTVSFVPAK
ncbi:MAG: penicillin acylase family protein [Acidobacteriota bacterium]|nr:penicillin acylase family protein [Acidobacteriota bacterium]